MKHITKKWLSVLLTVVLTFGYVGLLSGVVGDDPFGTKLTAHADTWNGTASNPGAPNYEESGNTVYLRNAQAFAWFIYQVNQNGVTYDGKTVYLTADVNLNGINLADSNKPLSGDYNDGRRFKGTFDGQNHKISNLKINKGNEHRIALFRTTENATFKNLKFENVNISGTGGYNGYAVLSGYHASNNLTFENVHIISGSISGYNYIGGLAGEVGENSGRTITLMNCSNGANITGSNVRIGGLVGSALPAVNATNCSNTGNVTAGSTDVGGIVGWIEDDPSTFSGCSNSGAIQGSDSVGGILGYFGKDAQDQKLTLTNNTNTGTITSNNRAAGICALIDTDNNAHEISGNTNRGTISAGSDAGGIVARNKGYGNWTNNRNYGSVTANGDNAGGICGEVEDDKQIFTNCFNSGTINGKNSTGGIVGWLNTAHENTFTNCGNSGAITSSSSYAGGIEGRGTGESSFLECYNTGTIKSNGNDGGGLAGSVDYHTFFTRCWNAGSVTVPSGKSAGGLIGYTSYHGADTGRQMVMDCYNWGAINGGYVGGLVGYVKDNQSYKIEYSYNTGTLSGSNATWQFVGYGGSVGDGCYKNVNTGSGTYKTNQEFIDYNFKIDDNFYKNPGVTINGTVYQYPILKCQVDELGFELPEGCATMYATESNNSTYRTGINYTIHNLTTGNSFSYVGKSGAQLFDDGGVYRKTYQTGADITASQGTLDIDRSKYSTVQETGLYVEYSPFIRTQKGKVRWGMELFPQIHLS